MKGKINEKKKMRKKDVIAPYNESVGLPSFDSKFSLPFQKNGNNHQMASSVITATSQSNLHLLYM